MLAEYWFKRTMHKDKLEGIEILKRSLELNPTHMPIIITLSSYLIDRAQKEGAYKLLRSATEITGCEAPIWYNISKLLFQNRGRRELIDFCMKKAVNKDESLREEARSKFKVKFNLPHVKVDLPEEFAEA
jgi:tetratricopeptide (TPR) repeat protein